MNIMHDYQRRQQEEGFDPSQEVYNLYSDLLDVYESAVHAMQEGKRYTVHLYHGGERPNEQVNTNSLSTAQALSLRAEHGLIIDNLKGEAIS